MRTTLTLDDDVALLLDQTRAAEGRRLREIVNDALRRGLPQILSSARRTTQPTNQVTQPTDQVTQTTNRVMSQATNKPARTLYATPSVSVGRCLIDNVDDVAGVLAMGEGEDFK